MTEHLDHSEQPSGKAHASNAAECGIIMPISPTADHDASHWADVQELLHRAVRFAGLEPKNVWAGSTIDRITPRILGNLFSVPIAVCDITDLNPNVMLELGMRLTTKKPTIIVAEHGSRIPFDIRDFEAIFYPAGLNILKSEKFIAELTEQITAKYNAFVEGNYQPFLHGLAVDFLEPRGQAIPFEQLVERRLDTIVSKIESMTAAPKTQPQASNSKSSNSESEITSDLVVQADNNRIAKKAAELINNKLGFQGSIYNNCFAMPFSIPISPPTISTVEELLRDNNIKAVVKVESHDFDRFAKGIKQ